MKPADPQTTTLTEAIRLLDGYHAEDQNKDHQFMMFVERIDGQWRPESRTVLAEVPTYTRDDYKEPAAPEGTQYFLESTTLQNVLETLADHLEVQNPALEQKVEAAIFYAENDCYLPVGEYADEEEHPSSGNESA